MQLVPASFKGLQLVQLEFTAECLGYFVTQNPNEVGRGAGHQTVRVTPAMEAGIVGHIWSTQEIVWLP